MEISLDNSFKLVVQITLLPWWRVYEKCKLKLMNSLCFVITQLLRKPPIMISIVSIFTAITFSICVYSIFVMMSVICFIAIILLFQGFIILNFVTYSIFISVITLLCIIFLGIATGYCFGMD